ncbi:hypothetical protein KIN20_022236 [Parelaphostrongylus tenuis]|uniref:Uncharacterized protein n=1 Tax=Parelaphostrongylus tenuis TaxID=148309 RepID=A0AAD5QV26_PARTN|nr:hypothetical protein KIN20_022236 [Parelaphostrongylus tenuis]
MKPQLLTAVVINGFFDAVVHGLSDAVAHCSPRIVLQCPSVAHVYLSLGVVSSGAIVVGIKAFTQRAKSHCAKEIATHSSSSRHGCPEVYRDSNMCVAEKAL